MHATSELGATDVALSWEIGGADQSVVRLLDRTLDGYLATSVELPDALGTLVVDAGDVDPWVQVSAGGSVVCNAASCELAFPAPGVHAIEAWGEGRLIAFWQPASLLVDTVVDATRALPLEVPEGTRSLHVRASGAQEVRLMRGTFTLCSGTTSCTVDEPLSGSWSAHVVTDAQTVVKVGLVGVDTPGVPDVPEVPEVPETPEPPLPPGPEGSESAVVIGGFGTVSAHLAAGGSQWFFLDVPGPVAVSTTGTTDTMGTWWWGDADQATDDDSGVDTNFRLVDVPGAHGSRWSASTAASRAISSSWWSRGSSRTVWWDGCSRWTSAPRRSPILPVSARSSSSSCRAPAPGSRSPSPGAPTADSLEITVAALEDGEQARCMPTATWNVPMSSDGRVTLDVPDATLHVQDLGIPLVDASYSGRFVADGSGVVEGTTTS
ncbi:MAG: hypothetical protein H6734_15805 [Alphaproteobacteria bacterium]|nr:hypothetical protein [Alphaproteobacteria bacterium]